MEAKDIRRNRFCGGPGFVRAFASNRPGRSQALQHVELAAPPQVQRRAVFAWFCIFADHRLYRCRSRGTHGGAT